jgi:GT2 family glycosyltransferase
LEIAVVILNYNGENFLEKFLPHVVEHSKNATIYVADNCSTDNSVSYLKTHFPDIKLIINTENGGFAKGYNDALKHIKADYYVLLNSDIEVTPNWIEPCIDLLEKDKTIAALQPKVLAYHNKTHFEHAGAAGGYLDQDFYPFCQGRIFDEVEFDNGQYNKSHEVFWATGACLFIRSELYHSIGGLDDDFFAHMEEIDMCWRLKQQNHKIYYCADSTIYHVGGGTLNYDNPKKTYLNFRNSLFMIAKNYDGNLFLKIFKRLLIDGLAGVMFIFKFQFKHFWAILKAHFSFYRNLKTLLKKRKTIKQNRTRFNSVGLFKGSIIFKKYIKGIKKFSDLKTD